MSNCFELEILEMKFLARNQSENNNIEDKDFKEMIRIYSGGLRYLKELHLEFER